MRYLLILSLLFITIISSCTKPVDFTPKYTFKGDGYIMDYYKDTVIPNIAFEVMEDTYSNGISKSFNRGTIVSDSKGHFNYELKFYNLESAIYTYCTTNNNYAIDSQL